MESISLNEDPNFKFQEFITEYLVDLHLDLKFECNGEVSAAAFELWSDKTKPLAAALEFLKQQYFKNNNLTTE